MYMYIVPTWDVVSYEWHNIDFQEEDTLKPPSNH